MKRPHVLKKVFKHLSHRNQLKTRGTGGQTRGTETIRGLRGHTGNNLHSIIHPLFPPFPLACDKTLPD